MLGRDVVAVRAEAAEVGGAGGDELDPPVGEVRRHLDADVGHQPARVLDQALHVLDRDRRTPTRAEAAGTRASRRPRRRRCASTRARPRRRSPPARARSSAGAARSSAGSPPGCGRARRAARRSPRATPPAPARLSPIPTRMPLVNGIRSSPAARIVSRRRAGCFVGEPACTVSIRRSEIDSSISPCDAVTSRRRARSSRDSTPRFVCGSRPRSSARSHVHTT